jgi:ADP-heptose:LPS heptosyltransferase/predicted SAM-dependent methyltransferase
VTWKIDDPMGNEARKIAWEIVRYTRGRGLDIGCGPRKTFPHWIGIDNCVDTKLFGIPMEPDIRIEDARDLSLFQSKTMDFVFSSHLLEHIDPKEVASTLKEWWRLVKDGGFMTLYLPDEDEYPKIGEPGANLDHKWNVNRDRVIEYMRSIQGWDLIDFQKRNQDKEYSLYFVFKKIKQGQYFSCDKPKPLKTAAVIRYGAWGDLLMTSSVLRGLKRQGYHVTLFCSPPQSGIMANDPNVDDFYLQDKDQVPNGALGEFWAHQKKKFDKFVNLCESVEGSFLTLPGRAMHEWPPALRHKMLNRNYLEVAHELAGIPHDPYVRFYPTQEERDALKRERSKMGRKVLVWALAGSAGHKTYAGLDTILASIMVNHKDWDVVLMGNDACKILEQGWEKEPRVHRRSGLWSIRESMTFLEYADCVVGPETGIMNAASSLSVPKVVFLSHSSDENLTRDWENCISLSSKNTVCPGRGNNEAPACHQMHYSFEFCRKHESGVSQCMADIPIGQAWHAIEYAMHYQQEAVA